MTLNRFALFFFLYCISISLLATDKIISWDFPINRPLAGPVLGNGKMGLMVWGDSNQLNLTVSKAGFWDHRGQLELNTSNNYDFVKNCLENRLYDTLQKAFRKETKAGIPKNPYQIGGGRLEVYFPTGSKIKNLQLNLTLARIQFELVLKNQQTIPFLLEMSTESDLAWLLWPEQVQLSVQCAWKPAFHHLQTFEKLSTYSIAPPVEWRDSSSIAHLKGFTQKLPQDSALTLAVALFQNALKISSSFALKGREHCKSIITQLSIREATASKDRWWKTYWSTCMDIQIPNAKLQKVFEYNLYKQGCSTPPEGKACGLQGPFMEEYRLPPWSNDFHFNINEQMIYMAALPSNKPEHFKPLWKMVDENRNKLYHYGKTFFGVDSALLIPHAVNDRLDIQGGFWTGNIDHGSTAWVAQMAYQYYRYTLDTHFLKNTAYPLLKGTFEGFWKMKTYDSAQRMYLPISVSPEFKGARNDAWGSNASFQLAAFHSTAQLLLKSAQILKINPDVRWAEVEEKLPPYSLIKRSKTLEYPEYLHERIALWDSMDLIESHRHHSHLASIYPFKTIDPFDVKHKKIVANSLYHWLRKGSGSWTGWCVPWAASIWCTMHEGDAAERWLNWWADNFLNEGLASLHDASVLGVSTTAQTSWARNPDLQENKEIMQLDAGFGLINTLSEFFVQNRKDTVVILPSIPLHWKSFQFDRIRTEGAFLLSGVVQNGHLYSLEIKSLKGGLLNLEYPGKNGIRVLSKYFKPNEYHRLVFPTFQKN